MRLGLSTLLLALSPCVVASYAMAEEAPTSLIQIDDQLFTKHSELSDARKALDEQNTQATNQQAELTRLSQQAKTLDEAFNKAKETLERDYQRMIDDPAIDIAASQQRYQSAWADVKQNQKSRLEAEQKLEELKQEQLVRQAAVDALQQTILGLDSDKLRARADRLKAELKVPAKLPISFTNRCQAELTLAQCDTQTRELALQKAVKQFRASIADQTSEANLVQRNLNAVALNIHVLRHSVSESGFYDGVRYRTIMDVELEARPAEAAACSLLNIDKQYCFAPGTQFDDTANVEQEVAWVTLSVRSNLFNDKVTIDGVHYGSTPLEVMLPVGSHQVTVTKEGYRTFNQTLSVNKDQTLRATLNEIENPLKAGDKFADGLPGGTRAPEMITILPGRYFIGEHASYQAHLDHAFGIGATPVTVTQFSSFVEQTNYQTDAELQNTCTAIVNGEVTPVANSYWRNPGFKQYANSPVVCVSQNDANAYARWLTKQTGALYRLPTEEEWEVAARAGSQDRYWWGDKFVPGQANTGWSGTPWANKSTSPVSAFKPNPLGLYDAVGNVWQWTNSARHIAKGGAWNFAPDMSAAHQQLYLSDSTATNYVGFRVVRDIN